MLFAAAATLANARSPPASPGTNLGEAERFLNQSELEHVMCALFLPEDHQEYIQPRAYS